jgi:DNA-binding NtrC family response regulator
LDATIRSLDGQPPGGARNEDADTPPYANPAPIHTLERRVVKDVLRANGGNKQKTAKTLGLSRKGLI